MSQSEKKRRKAILNDLCAKFGIDCRTDSRRSDAAIAFIAYGEKYCRVRLAQAGRNYANWERLVDMKRAGKTASMIAQQKNKSQKNELTGFNSRISRKQKRCLQYANPVPMFQYTVGADGAVTTRKKLSPEEEQMQSHRI